MLWRQKRDNTAINACRAEPRRKPGMDAEEGPSGRKSDMKHVGTEAVYWAGSQNA
jgi:hypothetical protein